jgi:hypothetical protein
MEQDFVLIILILEMIYSFELLSLLKFFICTDCGATIGIPGQILSFLIEIHIAYCEMTILVLTVLTGGQRDAGEKGSKNADFTLDIRR